jgi:hypothetical protein
LVVVALVGLALLVVVVAERLLVLAWVVGVGVLVEAAVAVGTLALGGTVETANQTLLPILRLQILILRH